MFKKNACNSSHYLMDIYTQNKGLYFLNQWELRPMTVRWRSKFANFDGPNSSGGGVPDGLF